MELLYDSVPDTLSQLIRTAFIPTSGNRFIIADYSAIEARVIAWLAGEKTPSRPSVTARIYIARLLVACSKFQLKNTAQTASYDKKAKMR